MILILLVAANVANIQSHSKYYSLLWVWMVEMKNPDGGIRRQVVARWTADQQVEGSILH